MQDLYMYVCFLYKFTSGRNDSNLQRYVIFVRHEYRCYYFCNNSYKRRLILCLFVKTIYCKNKLRDTILYSVYKFIQRARKTLNWKSFIFDILHFLVHDSLVCDDWLFFYNFWNRSDYFFFYFFILFFKEKDDKSHCRW